MKPNWGIIGVLLIGIIFWSNVWFNGFFSSIMWFIIVGAMSGIYLKVTGRM